MVYYRENWSLQIINTWSKLFLHNFETSNWKHPFFNPFASVSFAGLRTPFGLYLRFLKSRSWCMSSCCPADRSSSWCLLPYCHLCGLERAGSVKNHSTVLILLHPVLQRQLKLLIAAPVSLRWIIRWGGDLLFEDGSSGVGFPGMGYLNYDWWRGNVVSWLDSCCIRNWPVSWQGQIRMAVRPVSPPTDIGLINSSDDHGLTTRPFISSYDMYLSW